MLSLHKRYLPAALAKYWLYKNILELIRRE
jgi:hypothetical protein